MAFMMKKKRYKFNVHLCVEDLTAVPFLNAVLFVKVRLLDGGTFNETSSREEVRDHTVRWGAKFEIICKMSANASTGVLEQCNLRISVRKELKGGRSFQKLGFTDLNLAEFAGCGETTRRCLLEGYDSKYRQDNSMLRIRINMNMLSGDVLFKVPSPSVKQKSLSTSSNDNDLTITSSDRFSRDDFPGGSTSSGFGSLPKKRPPLLERLNSDSSNTIPNSEVTNDGCNHYTNDDAFKREENDSACHSRNSSSASHLSKLSHSRQSSSGESATGHVRSPSWPTPLISNFDLHTFATPRIPSPTASLTVTPVSSRTNRNRLWSFNSSPLRLRKPLAKSPPPVCGPPSQPQKVATGLGLLQPLQPAPPPSSMPPPPQPPRQQSPQPSQPVASSPNGRGMAGLVTPTTLPLNKCSSTNTFRFPPWSGPSPRAVSSPGLLPVTPDSPAPRTHGPSPLMHHGKYEGANCKLSSLINNSKIYDSSSDVESFLHVHNSKPSTNTTSNALFSLSRRTSQITLSGSSCLSETGSLDRGKSALERRKKAAEESVTSGRVEITRVNTDTIIEQLIKSTNLEPSDGNTDSTGLQLFISKDGATAIAVGGQDVKHQTSSGVFKKVVMEEHR